MGKYLETTKDEYPIGSIVFFTSTDHELFRMGITHVGIVVGFDGKTPIIAHANNGKNAKHVVIAKLQNNMGYLVAKPPNYINRSLLVALAQTLATRDKNEEPIIKYSVERSNTMNECMATLYNKNIKHNRNGNVIMQERTRALTVQENLAVCHRALKQNSWKTVLAKSCNLFRSNLSIRLQNINLTEYSKTIFGEKVKDLNIHYPITNFTRKGYHCVQFVVMVLQMTAIYTNKSLKNAINTNKPNLTDLWYLSRNNTERKENEVFQPIDPCTIIKVAYEDSFEEIFYQQTLAVDGKYLSPAGLIAILDNYYPPGSGGPPGGGMDAWRFSSNLANELGNLELNNAVAALSQEVNNTDREQTGYAKLVTQLLNLWSVRRIVRKITPIRVPAASLSNNKRPKKRKDTDRDPGERNIPRPRLGL